MTFFTLQYSCRHKSYNQAQRSLRSYRFLIAYSRVSLLKQHCDWLNFKRSHWLILSVRFFPFSGSKHSPLSHFLHIVCTHSPAKQLIFAYDRHKCNMLKCSHKRKDANDLTYSSAVKKPLSSPQFQSDLSVQGLPLARLGAMGHFLMRCERECVGTI